MAPGRPKTSYTARERAERAFKAQTEGAANRAVWEQERAAFWANRDRLRELRLAREREAAAAK
jgi:hypothetical protein